MGVVFGQTAPVAYARPRPSGGALPVPEAFRSFAFRTAAGCAPLCPTHFPRPQRRPPNGRH